MGEIEKRTPGELDYPIADPVDHPYLKALMRLAPRGTVAVDLWQDLHERSTRRAEEVLEFAAETAADRLDELLTELGSDERKADLLHRIIQAGARAGLEEKRRALGRALVEGGLANDDAEVDDAELLVRTLDDLTAAEIRSLAGHWGIDHGFSTSPAEDAITANLVRHGLIASNQQLKDARGYRRSDGETLRVEGNKVRIPDPRLPELERRWQRTEFGERLLRLLRESAMESAEPSETIGSDQ